MSYLITYPLHYDFDTSWKKITEVFCNISLKCNVKFKKFETVLISHLRWFSSIIDKCGHDSLIRWDPYIRKKKLLVFFFFVDFSCEWGESILNWIVCIECLCLEFKF